MFIVSNKRFYLRRVCLHQSIHTRAFLALTMVATVRVALFLYNATLNRRTSTQITATVPAATATPTGNDTSSSSRHGTPKVLLPQWYNAVAVSTPSACHRRPKAATAAPQGCHSRPPGLPPAAAVLRQQSPSTSLRFYGTKVCVSCVWVQGQAKTSFTITHVSGRFFLCVSIDICVL